MNEDVNEADEVLEQVGIIEIPDSPRWDMTDLMEAFDEWYLELEQSYIGTLELEE